MCEKEVCSFMRHVASGLREGVNRGFFFPPSCGVASLR